MGKIIRTLLLSGTLALSSGCVVSSANLAQRVNSYDYPHHVANMCNDGEYDNKDLCMITSKNYAMMQNSSFKIERKVLYEPWFTTPDDMKKDLKKAIRKHYGGNLIPRGQGTGVMLKNSYMLTATHIIGFDQPKRMYYKWKKDGRFYKLYPIQTFYFVTINGKKYRARVKAKGWTDASLVKVEGLPKDMKFPEVKFGKYKDIKPLNLVYLVGNGEGMGIQEKKGNVSKVHAREFFHAYRRAKWLKRFLKRWPRGIKRKHFTIFAGSQRGHSGGPAFLIRDGYPELGGILVLGTSSSHGIVLTADNILEDIGNKMKKLGAI